MTSTPFPSVRICLLSDTNNKHTPQQVNKKADQRNACEGKRATKGHPPIVHPSPPILNLTNKTPTACANKRQSCQSRLRGSGVNIKRPSPASTTTYHSTYAKPLTNLKKSEIQGTYVDMKYMPIRRPSRGLPLISAYLIHRNH